MTHQEPTKKFKKVKKFKNNYLFNKYLYVTIFVVRNVNREKVYLLCYYKYSKYYLRRLLVVLILKDPNLPFLSLKIEIHYEFPIKLCMENFGNRANFRLPVFGGFTRFGSGETK